MSIESVSSSHPLASPSPAFNLSQHQGLLQWISSLYEVAKLLKLSCPIYCPTLGVRGGLVFWMAIECVAQCLFCNHPMRGCGTWDPPPSESGCVLGGLSEESSQVEASHHFCLYLKKRLVKGQRECRHFLFPEINHEKKRRIYYREDGSIHHSRVKTLPLGFQVFR